MIFANLEHRVPMLIKSGLLIIFLSLKGSTFLFFIGLIILHYNASIFIS